MKKLIICFVCLVAAASSSAKTWRVDQNTANKPDYTSLQEALDAIPAGDTVLVSGYGNSYGAITIKKQVCIIGPGYFLDQYYNSSVNQFSAQLGQVTFSSGGENSEIMGCCVVTYPIVISCNNIIVKRNYIGKQYHASLQLSSVNNIIIQQNYIERDFHANTYDSDCFRCSGENIVIRNNCLNADGCYIYANGSGIISNNVLIGNVSMTGFHFINNIIVNGSISPYNSFINNNIGYGDIFHSSNGNIFGSNTPNVDMNTVFVGAGSTDGKWQLKDGSPAKGVGVNSTDCGMFGGDFPYILSGIPPLPTIYEAIIPPTANSKDGLPIRIKARTNP